MQYQLSCVLQVGDNGQRFSHFVIERNGKTSHSNNGIFKDLRVKDGGVEQTFRVVCRVTSKNLPYCNNYS